MPLLHKPSIINHKQLIFALVVFLLLFVPNSVSAAVSPMQKTIVRPNIIVSATIGIPKMTLWGYGPADSVLELNGIGVDQTTTSDQSGYYSFDLIYLPGEGVFPELCVTAIDNEGRTTPPTCIPPISGGDFFFDVGPVILPPTISIGAPESNFGADVSAQGKTIPNSTINIKLARPEIKSGVLGLRLVSHVLAFYIPNYTVTSDQNGDYSFNMPTNTATDWRVFAIANYRDGNKSPKSNTLKFSTLSLVAYAWESLWEFLKTLLYWPRIIILEILIILILAFIAWLVIHKKKGSSKKKRVPGMDQKHSEIIEKYQEFLAKKH